jgi:hypothetical protein
VWATLNLKDEGQLRSTVVVFTRTQRTRNAQRASIGGTRKCCQHFSTLNFDMRFDVFIASRHLQQILLTYADSHIPIYRCCCFLFSLIMRPAATRELSVCHVSQLHDFHVMQEHTYLVGRYMYITTCVYMQAEPERLVSAAAPLGVPCHQRVPSSSASNATFRCIFPTRCHFFLVTKL